MPVPKKRTSHSRTRTRRAHDFLTPKFAVVCSNCGGYTLQHHVCPSCGFYRGRQLVKKNADVTETPVA